MRVGCPLGTKMASMSRLTPDALVYETAATGEPQVSYDGTRVVYTLGRADRDLDRPTAHIYLSAVDGSDLRQLAQVGDRNREARWSPDDSQLAFVSDRQEGHSTLCLLPTQPGEARELTSHRQAIGNLAWSPDGRSIAYTTPFDPDNPDEEPPPKNRAPRVKVTRRLDYKQDNRGWLNDVRIQVFVVDVASGERRRLTSEPDDLWYPQWSPDGTTLAARMTRDNGIFSHLALIDVADSSIKKRIGPERGSVGVWSWSPAATESCSTATATRALVRTSSCTTSPPTRPAPHDRPALYARRWFSDGPCALAAGLARRITRSWSTLCGVARAATTASTSTPASSRASTTRAPSALASVSTVPSATSSSRTRVWMPRARSRSTTARPASGKVVTNHNAELLEAGAPRRGSASTSSATAPSSRPGSSSPPASIRTRTYPVVLDVHGGPHGFYGYGFNAIQQVLASHGFVGRLLEPARLRLVRARVRSSRSTATGAARTTWT